MMVLYRNGPDLWIGIGGMEQHWHFGIGIGIGSATGESAVWWTSKKKGDTWRLNRFVPIIPLDFDFECAIPANDQAHIATVGEAREKQGKAHKNNKKTYRQICVVFQSSGR